MQRTQKCLGTLMRFSSRKQEKISVLLLLTAESHPWIRVMFAVQYWGLLVCSYYNFFSQRSSFMPNVWVLCQIIPPRVLVYLIFAWKMKRRNKSLVNPGGYNVLSNHCRTMPLMAKSMILLVSYGGLAALQIWSHSHLDVVNVARLFRFVCHTRGFQAFSWLDNFVTWTRWVNSRCPLCSKLKIWFCQTSISDGGLGMGF